MDIGNKNLVVLTAMSLLLFVHSVCVALPFNIVPQAGTTLPTQITPGQTLKAFYTVSNNTGGTRQNNFVKYLPPGVSQVTFDPTYSDLCGSAFNLAPAGQAGSSCLLELNVTSTVSNNDPNPHHHLFVCTAGGTTCAGTNNGLNVSTRTQAQYAYIANIGNGTISVCSVNSNGSLGTCSSQTDSSFNFVAGIVLNNSASIAYVTNSGNNTVSICNINSNGTLSPCNIKTDGTLDTPAGLRLNSNNTFLYIANFGSNTISSCPVNADGSLSTCRALTANGTLREPFGIGFNPNSTRAFIPNSEPGNNTVTICPVNSDASFGTCSTSTGNGTFIRPEGADVSADGKTLYVTNRLSNVSICPINSNGSLGTCTTSTGNGTFAFRTQTDPLAPFMSNNQFGYITNDANNTISICPLNSNGSFGTCTLFSNLTLNRPVNAWLAFGK